MTSLLLYLPDPVGWIALTPEDLREAQGAAQDLLGSCEPDKPRSATKATVATELLDAEDAARRLAVDASLLLRLAREGRIDHVRIGKYVRFRPDTVIEQHRRLARDPATYAHTSIDATARRRV